MGFSEQEYYSFELVIAASRETAGNYHIRLINSPVAAIGGMTTFKLDDDISFIRGKLQELVMVYTKMSVNFDEFESARSYVNAQMEEIGYKLYTMLPPPIRKALEKAYQLAITKGFGLRIAFDLADSPKLQPLPWEFLFNPATNNYFALSPATPLVRIVRTPVVFAPPTPSPLKVLVVAIATATSDYEFLPEELKAIQEAYPKHIQLHVLDGLVTLKDLKAQLSFHTYHYIHLIAHGTWDNATNTARLLFHAAPSNNSQELFLANLEPDAVGADDLRQVLAVQPATTLILNSCHSGEVSSEEIRMFESISASLVKAGVGTVIALQAEMTQAAAVSFAAELHQQLAQGNTLMTALAEARRSLFLESRTRPELLGQWFIPVLYHAAPPLQEDETWFDRISDRWQTRINRLGGDRGFIGSLFLLIIVGLAGLLLQPMLGRIVPEDANWRNLFLRWDDFLVLPSSKIWQNYLIEVYLPLTIYSLLIILLVTGWINYDMRQAKILGQLNQKQRSNLLLHNLLGANLGFITGIFFGYILVAPIFYYARIGDLLPGVLQELIKFLAVLPGAIGSLWLARQLPINVKAAFPDFFPDCQTLFITFGSLIFVPAIYFFVFMVTPAFFLARPQGGILVGICFLILLLYEGYKAVRNQD